MESLRELVAILGFVIGATLITLVFANEFEWVLLIIGLSCFVFSYFTWPSKKRGKREGDSPILDIIELVIEFPVEFFMWFFRLLGRIFSSIFGGKDGGVDIDF